MGRSVGIGVAASLQLRARVMGHAQPRGSCPSHLSLQAFGSEDHTLQEPSFPSLADLTRLQRARHTGKQQMSPRAGEASQGAPIPVEGTCADPGHTPRQCAGEMHRESREDGTPGGRSSPRGGEGGSEHLGTRSAQGQGLHQLGEAMGATFPGHVTCRDIPMAGSSYHHLL